MKVTERNRFTVGDILQLIVGAVSNKVSGWVRNCEIRAENGTIMFLELSVLDPIRKTTGTRIWREKDLDTEIKGLSIVAHKYTEEEWEGLCRLARNLKIIERME